MASKTTKEDRNSSESPIETNIDQLETEELEQLQSQIQTVLNHREHDTDLSSAETADLVNGEFVKWRTLSAHSNLKAVKPWILKVTGTHNTYTVDGDWLDKLKIDGDHHMSVTPLEDGDIIKVSGASHNNKKHRYYRVLAITDDTLYYSPDYGLDEKTVIEEVA